MTTQPRTMFEKIWNDHVVVETPNQPTTLYIDLHLVHEVTSPQAFQGLRDRGLKVRRPSRTFGTLDHSTPTTPPSVPIQDEMAARQIRQMEANCHEFGVPLAAMDSDRRGIVHVIGPEMGLTQPGMTIVCGDSHTSTHGAFGALAFGIGTSEVGHVLATQCLLQQKPRTCEVRIDGRLNTGVTAKDVILALIAKIGVGGGTGYVVEYAGSSVAAMSVEERMTVCNMTIEAGARSGMVAPDDVTFEYLAGRPGVPRGDDWQAAVNRWRQLRTDEGAHFDQRVSLQVDSLEPMITYGTNPGMGIAVSARIPDPDILADVNQRQAARKALAYMGLKPGEPMAGRPIDVVFIGSCTNSRISDLRQAATVFKGRKVKPGVRAMVVPGSYAIKQQAEEEGLDRIFREAGAEWREPGCSMCIAMNGDQLLPGQYAVSTSNRNFEGRQGPAGRTFLASPLTAAASAVTGVVTDVRTLE